jgi:hypothetical protein
LEAKVYIKHTKPSAIGPGVEVIQMEEKIGKSYSEESIAAIKAAKERGRNYVVVEGKQVKLNKIHLSQTARWGVMQGMREFAPRGPKGYRYSIDKLVDFWAKHPTRMGQKEEASKHLNSVLVINVGNFLNEFWDKEGQDYKKASEKAQALAASYLVEQRELTSVEGPAAQDPMAVEGMTPVMEEPKAASVVGGAAQESVGGMETLTRVMEEQGRRQGQQLEVLTTIIQESARDARENAASAREQSRQQMEMLTLAFRESSKQQGRQMQMLTAVVQRAFQPASFFNPVDEVSSDDANEDEMVGPTSLRGRLGTLRTKSAAAKRKVQAATVNNNSNKKKKASTKRDASESPFEPFIKPNGEPCKLCERFGHYCQHHA